MGAQRVTRRRALGCMGCITASWALAGCGSDTNGTPQDGGARAVSSADADSGVLEPPTVTLSPLALAGTEVVPVTGIGLSLAAGAKVYTPELAAQGRTQVTYVWPDQSSWGYLVVEGPGSFDASTATAAWDAVLAERQRLIAASLRPSDASPLEWTGMSQAAVITWNQKTIPPGWTGEVSVDAVEAALVDGAGRSYTLVAYGAHGTLDERHPAVATLCTLHTL